MWLKTAEESDGTKSSKTVKKSPKLRNVNNLLKKSASLPQSRFLTSRYEKEKNEYETEVDDVPEIHIE